MPLKPQLVHSLLLYVRLLRQAGLLQNGKQLHKLPLIAIQVFLLDHHNHRHLLHLYILLLVPQRHLTLEDIDLLVVHLSQRLICLL